MLTKSKYLKGLQCSRLLWKAEKKELPEISLADQHRFNQGALFEKEVHKLFKGVNLSELEFKENIDKTKELVDNKKTIFEAGFQYNDLYVRSDILEYDDGWNLYEIKSTTSVKKHHIPDLAFQKYVLKKLGIEVKKCFVLFLNKEYVKKGKIDVKQLVSKEEVTEKVNEVEIEPDKYLEVLKGSLPDMIISPNCNKPYPCPLKKECWGTLPKDNVLQLRKWQVYWKLFNSGIIEMKDVPDEGLTRTDMRIRNAAVSGKVFVSKDKIKEFLDKLVFPLYHFDFETFDTAVPIYDNSRPYQKIAFQYSLHIQSDKLEHFEYLADGKKDPRIGLLKKLKNEIKGKGSVVVFNKSFEISVFKKLAEDFPSEKPWIDDVISRIIDLADVFKVYDYYNPKQKGSYSIKKVLPAITGKGYSELEIGDGAEASARYFCTYIDKSLKKDISKELLEYCCLDTEGMVLVVDELEKLK